MVCGKCLSVLLVIVSMVIYFFYRTRQGLKIRMTFLEMFWITYGKCTSDPRLDGKVAIVTGSNTGIGKVTALEYCKRGARVIMACRNVEKAEEAALEIRAQTAGSPNAGTVVVKELDLASFKSVRKFAEEILETESKIHLLINNAGVMMCPREVTEDGQELQFQTNHLGHFLLTMLLLPRMISSAPARIVNVSSMAHIGESGGNMYLDDITLERSYTPVRAYSRSKLANVLFTNELARKLEGTGVTAYSLHPGVIKTEISRHMGTTVSPIFKQIIDSKFFSKFLKTPEEGAQTTLHCSLSEEAGKENGLYYSDCKPVKPAKEALDRGKAVELWTFSWSAVGLSSSYNPFVKG